MYIYIYIYIYILDPGHQRPDEAVQLRVLGQPDDDHAHARGELGILVGLPKPREFTKGGLVKGGFAIRHVFNLYMKNLMYYDWTRETHELLNPPLLNPPFANSRKPSGRGNRRGGRGRQRRAGGRAQTCLRPALRADNNSLFKH